MATRKPSPGKALGTVIFRGILTWLLVLFALHLDGWLAVAAWIYAGLSAGLGLLTIAGFGIVLDRAGYAKGATK